MKSHKLPSKLQANQTIDITDPKSLMTLGSIKPQFSVAGENNDNSTSSPSVLINDQNSQLNNSGTAVCNDQVSDLYFKSLLHDDNAQITEDTSMQNKNIKDYVDENMQKETLEYFDEDECDWDSFMEDPSQFLPPTTTSTTEISLKAGSDDFIGNMDPFFTNLENCGTCFVIVAHLQTEDPASPESESHNIASLSQSHDNVLYRTRTVLQERSPPDEFTISGDGGTLYITQCLKI